MTHNFWTGTQAVLQHISEILHSPFVIVSKHHFGKRVKVIERRSNYSFVTIGTICGYEYSKHNEFENGFFYYVVNELGYIENDDGTIKPYSFDRVDRVCELDIYPVTNQLLAQVKL